MTGALHMGHALNGSIQDTLIRMQRMQGQRAKWILGTDHAGIATQAAVEKLLAKEGTDRHELGREAFDRARLGVARAVRRHDHRAVQAPRRLAATTANERFTMDEAYVAAVDKVFVALYEKGLIYRDNYMVNWDPGSARRSATSRSRTARSRTRSTTIDYPLEDGPAS